VNTLFPKILCIITALGLVKRVGIVYPRSNVMVPNPFLLTALNSGTLYLKHSQRSTG